jgi:hypothetical protein
MFQMLVVVVVVVVRADVSKKYPSAIFRPSYLSSPGYSSTYGTGRG